MYGWISLSIPCSTSVTSMIASTAQLRWCGSANLGPRKATMPSICAAQITPLFWAWEMESSRKSLNPTSALGEKCHSPSWPVNKPSGLLSLLFMMRCIHCGFWSEITITHEVIFWPWSFTSRSQVAFWMQLIWMCRLKDLREWSRGKKMALASSSSVLLHWVTHE